jgi:hypothetical protein
VLTGPRKEERRYSRMELWDRPSANGPSSISSSTSVLSPPYDKLARNFLVGVQLAAITKALNPSCGVPGQDRTWRLDWAARDSLHCCPCLGLDEGVLERTAPHGSAGGFLSGIFSIADLYAFSMAFCFSFSSSPNPPPCTPTRMLEIKAKRATLQIKVLSEYELRSLLFT